MYWFLFRKILEKIFDCINVSNFKSNFSKRSKKFRHLSLFLGYMHFLTCKRSCEKCCRYCSRVRDSIFFDMDKFQDLVVCSKFDQKDDFLFLDDKMIDLDVYLNRPAYPNHPLKHLPCRYFKVLSHAQDLFVYFSSILVRMYLNYAIKYCY